MHGITHILILTLFITITGCTREINENLPPKSVDICTEFYDVWNNKTMFFSTWDDNFIYLHDYIEKYYPYVTLEQVLFAVIDMDGDGNAEFVVEYPEVLDIEVFHYKDGVIYGHNFGIRSMNGLKSDGTFGWANSGFDSGWGIYNFNGDSYQFIKLGRTLYSKDGEAFWINEVLVTEEEYKEREHMQREKSDVLWYQATEDNIWLCLLN